MSCAILNSQFQTLVVTLVSWPDLSRTISTQSSCLADPDKQYTSCMFDNGHTGYSDTASRLANANIVCAAANMCLTFLVNGRVQPLIYHLDNQFNNYKHLCTEFSISSVAALYSPCSLSLQEQHLIVRLD